MDDHDHDPWPGSKNPRVFFPDTLYTAPLEEWVTAIQRVPSEAEGCLIEQVVHYKALSDMEHEFLVVHACHPSGAKVVLGVDRNADVLTAAQQASTDASSESSWSVSSSARYISTFMRSCPPPPSPNASPQPAYDSVQVSHDATPAPILAQHGPSVPLSAVSFPLASCPAAAGEQTGHGTRPSLLHLSVLLLTIRTHFPSYALLQYQCYFFARATYLALVDLFDGVEEQHEGGQRAATWRGVHISLYSAGRAALQNMLLLPLAEFPVLIVPAGLFAVYSAVKLYDGNVVESEMDRRRIRYALLVSEWW